MPNYNYVREHRRFMRYASDNKLTASEFRLWEALFEIFNDEAEGNTWPDGFIRVSNGRVLTLCDPMGIDTMVRARNGLKQRGLIEFRPGSRNKENPAYRVKLFYSESYPQNEDNAALYTQNADNTGGNLQGNTWGNLQGNAGGNLQGNAGGNLQGNVGNIYIKQNENYTEPNLKFTEDDEEDEEEFLRAHARAEAAAAWTENFGLRPTPALTARIANAQATVWRFDGGVIAYAIQQAAVNSRENPAGYVIKCLNDWYQNNVFDLSDAEEYVFLLRASQNRADGPLSPEEAADRLEAFRHERENESGQELIHTAK